MSVFRKDSYRQLRCRSTPLRYVRSGQPERGFPCFVSEELKYPGFVEFDAVNERVLTFAAQRHEYKIWDLATYTCLFAITDRAIGEVKISPGALLVIYEPATKEVVQTGGNDCGYVSFMPIKVLSLEAGGSGDILHERELELEQEELPPSAPRSTASHKTIEFVEHSGRKVLFKQTGCPLKIMDLCTNEVIVVRHFVAPNSFIFLNKIQRFLVFRATLSRYSTIVESVSHHSKITCSGIRMQT